jgi:hypothetical protein
MDVIVFLSHEARLSLNIINQFQQYQQHEHDFMRLGFA